MKWPFVTRKEYDLAIEGWCRTEEIRAERTRQLLDVKKDLYQAQLEIESLWKLLNKNANKPQRRDNNGKFAK